MALINCPECGKEISDAAKNCINCGFVLKEEADAVPQQSVVRVEVNSESKSSKNFLVKGITLNLCCLFLSTVNAVNYILGEGGNNVFRDIKFLFVISIIAAVLSFVGSLVLLAKPKTRNVKTVIAYLAVNVLAGFYTLCFLDFAVCGFVIFVPQLIALAVSYVLILASLFIKDEKQ